MVKRTVLNRKGDSDKIFHHSYRFYLRLAVGEVVEYQSYYGLSSAMIDREYFLEQLNICNQSRRVLIYACDCDGVGRICGSRYGELDDCLIYTELR